MRPSRPARPAVRPTQRQRAHLDATAPRLRRKLLPMKIRVLGCSGAIAAGCKTTAFLLDDDVLIDAGSGVGDLALDELFRIEHILLSHSHLDHILSVPLLADSVIRHREELRRPPIQVHALPQTIEALRKHIFNGVIWPDFSRLPSAEEPVLRFVPFAQGDVLDLGGRHVEVLTANHTVPAVGFALQIPPASGLAGAPNRWWVFTGDTGPNAALWQRLRSDGRGAPRHRDRVQRRGERAWPGSAGTCARRCWARS